MSVAEIAAGLQAVIDAVATQRRQLATIVADLHRTRGRFHAVTAASGHRLIGDTLRQHAEAAERLQEADRLLANVPAALAEFAAALGATVRPATMAREHPQQALHLTSPEDVSPLASMADRSDTPAAVVRLAARLNPWREGENAKAFAFDSDRRHLNDEPFTSGRVKAAADGLRPVRGGGHPVTVTDHVEGHVAARMRLDGGPSDVTLVINKAPCDDRPFGCDQLLPHIIPPGSRLTVYVVEADGPRFHRTYTGTGKAITA